MRANRERNRPERTRGALAVVAAAGFTALALWLSLRDIEWAAVGGTLARADYRLVAAAVASSLIATYAPGWRWRILLAPRIRPSMGRLFRWNILAQFANIVIPARANELVRAWLTSVEGGTSGGFALGTIAVERIFDVGVFAAALTAGPWIFGLGKGAVPPAAGHALAALSLVSLAFLIVLALRPAAFLRMADAASRVLPSRWRAKATTFFGHVADAFVPLRDAGTAAAIAANSIFLLFLEVMTIWIMFRAFHLDLPFGAALLMVIVKAIGNVPPAAPGRIGIFEVAIIAALAAYGLPRSETLGLAIVLHLVVHVPKIVLGALFLGLEPVPIFKLAQAAKDGRVARERDAGQGPRLEGGPPSPGGLP